MGLCTDGRYNHSMRVSNISSYNTGVDMIDTSFFEVRKVHGQFELFLNKEIDGKRNALLVERDERMWRLTDKCRLNSDFRHLQANAQ